MTPRVWGRISLLAAAVLACGLLTPLHAQTGGATGTARDEKGNLLAGYMIVLERQEIKWTSHVKTDKKGEYTYIGLAPGNYKFSLQDPNGRVLFYITRHIGLGEPTVVDFDLAKERAQQQQEMKSNPDLQQKLADQAKEQKMQGSLVATFNEGRALSAEKKYAEAAAKFEEALPLAKPSQAPIILENLADAYRRARQYDKAVETYQKAIQATPSQATLHDGLGNVYADMGKMAEAQQEFVKAAELDPGGAAREYFNAAVVLVNKGKMDEALAFLKKVTDADPKFADAYYWEGQALFGKATVTPDGKTIPAPGTVEAFETYLKLDPSGKYATEAQAALQALQSTVQMEYKTEKKKKK